MLPAPSRGAAVVVVSRTGAALGASVERAGSVCPACGVQTGAKTEVRVITRSRGLWDHRARCGDRASHSLATRAHNYVVSRSFPPRPFCALTRLVTRIGHRKTKTPERKEAVH